MAYYERSVRFGFGGGMTTAVKYLLIINGVVYVLQHLVEMLFGSGPEPLLIKFFGLHPAWFFSKFQIWPIFSYMFLHDQKSLLHLLFNMFVLWMFGCEVERTLGFRQFIKYYVICGIGAGLLHLIIYYDSPVPVVGASGAIYGVMVAFAVLFPDRHITLLLFFILPVQILAKYLVMIFVGIALFYGVVGLDKGVAHFAHLGGAATGFIFLKLDWRLDYFGAWLRRKRESRQLLQKLKKEQNMQRFRERVDAILDKINEVGYDKLNAEEKRILQEASEQLSRQKEPEN
jgi:membrane associated rhomboid family serine protease